jgi:microcystin-dependent protein
MDPYLGEIRIFTGNFAPTGWAMCNGQLLPISQNTALFSILGTTYGGNGMSTFALPNLQGAAPLGWGSGAGLTLRDLGETGGSTTVTLIQSQMPSHSHGLGAYAHPGDLISPAGGAWAEAGAVRGQKMYAGQADPGVQMSLTAISAAGGGLPHNNLPPYLTLNFIIALLGVFPPRA